MSLIKYWKKLGTENANGTSEVTSCTTITSSLFHSLRDLLSCDHHDSELANHDGCESTLNRLKHLYWQGMRHDVVKYVKSCRKCQLRKTERHLPTGKLYSFEASRKLELIATDYIEIPRPSTENNRFIVLIVHVFTPFLFAKVMPEKRGYSSREKEKNQCGGGGQFKHVVS